MTQLFSLSLFLHLIAFAVYAGAALFSAKLLRKSAEGGLAAPARDALEAFAANVVTKSQLPAIFLSVISGVMLLVAKPAYLKNPGMHIKLTIVFILLVLSHLEMFNARKIVRARAAGSRDAEIQGRKGRHGLFSTIDLVGILSIVGIVAFMLLG